MNSDRFDLEHLLAEDCAEHPVPAVWVLVLLAVFALPVLVVMLRF